MIFARKIPEFYIVGLTARKIFVQNPPLLPISYAYKHMPLQWFMQIMTTYVI